MEKCRNNQNKICRLHDKMWDDISAGDFACKPEIVIPDKFVFGSPGVNVTLSCLVSGSPAPQVGSPPLSSNQ